MALDYSKLSDNDLEALTNEDYSKLSDETLKALAEDNTGPHVPEEGTQGTSPVGAAVGAGKAAYEVARPLVHGAAHILSNPAVDVIGGAAVAPWALRQAGKYMSQGAQGQTGFTGGANQAWDKALAQRYGAAQGAIENIASKAAAVPGLVPAAAFSMPYAMAAHEQAKIRENPNAPQYATNPYAMQQRGVAPTQGAAGVMNQRAAVHNFNTAGNPMPGTPEFAAMQAPAIGGPAAEQGANFIDEIKKKYGMFLGR